VKHAIRRVVTGHDGSGKAVVLMDGIAPNVKVRQGAGFVHSLLWVTDEAPADISGHGDRADRTLGVTPPPAGSILRMVDFPPVTPEAEAIDHAALINDMGAGHESHGGRPARHPYMHRTRTLDYAIVLEGEIDLLLDESEVHLRAGDVIVQQGTSHAWVNRSSRTCRVAFVLIDAQEPHPTKENEP
jgi:mannose-6-phosphate isomerase-like protein (cupin superfamily)